MLKLNKEKPAAAEVWRKKGRSEMRDDTEALHCIMSTPFLKGGFIYGVCSYGDLRCLKADSGERLWETNIPTGGTGYRWANAFMVNHEDRVVLFNEQGDLILAKMSPQGYTEISRANILQPTNVMAGPKGRRVIWSHPAFANRHVYARNDREIVCVSLAASK
jgi:outer membrane protein assembly factor BamB